MQDPEEQALTQRLRIRIDPTTEAWAEVAAEEEGMSVSRWVRKQIRVGYRLQQKSKKTLTDES